MFVCQDARGSRWQLGPLPPRTGRLTLIGWKEPGEQTDAGVPEAVAPVLGRALTSVARVTFPSSNATHPATAEWLPSNGNLVRALTVSGFAGRIAAKWNGTPTDITLMSTRHPEAAMRLFDDAEFPWWMQGQVALLSSPDRPPPNIETAPLLALFGEEWSEHAASLAEAGVTGVVRPGVDGDVAGLLSSTEEVEQMVLSALESEARGAGFDWAVLSESAFVLK